MMSRKEEDSNPFYCDDDETDNSCNRDGLPHIQAKIDRSESQQLQSLDRSLRVLHETEHVGFATAEEMLRQKEQLVNAEQKLDTINETTKVTQRHLTSIKSVFGAFKNKFFSRPDPPESFDSKSDNIQHNRLKETLEEDFAGRDYSASRRGTSGAGYDTLESEEDSGLNDISISSSTKQSAYDDRLGDLNTSLNVLKNLGRGMNAHLKDEDELLTRLANKTEKADMTLEKQNKQIRGMLK